MKYAYINNNIAIEVVESNPQILFVPHYAAQFIEVTDDCFGGYELVNGQWQQPPTPVQIPQEVTMRQARLALLDAGLLSSVQPAINSLPEPAKTRAQIEWDYSNALQRGNSFVATLGTSLGLNEESLDNLFITAAKL
jgi:hypothetical protein